MRFTTLIALFGVAAASENKDMQALAKQEQQAVKGDMVALITLLDTIEMKNAPVMLTTIAARKSELQKELKANPDRKEEIRSELQTLLTLVENMEKEDFDAGLTTLAGRKDHLMSLHKEMAPMNLDSDSD